MSRRSGSVGGPKTLISLRVAAELAGGVHPRTVRRWVDGGLLQGFQVGPRLIKVDRDQVLALVRPLNETGVA
ncbi:DNA-binding protein [Nocardia sp. NPDC004168]|uniref:DNA-binding protein n=1 Tax=Nocardia implantans TaxID=3108168 RepID=A0ABU6AZ05_9NOCA|nr:MULTISPECIES: DNA-binding protein [unclassified Nocardia]MBF6190556.1 DNA-binding protein [Nocardia beijingensis]MEA3528469.1 DNA-binding protein [Nocardia sp. CDC192]MEB3512379.1 DNA-binding protein [Nocardia sp. CDC186]